MAKALQNVDRIQFCIDVLTIKNGRKLGQIRPDEKGYYEIPLAVLGTVTDNRTYYEVEEFVSQLTSPNSFINRVLTDGKLYGEFGHPMILLLDDDKKLPRLMLVDEKNVSHHISSIRTGEKLENGGVLLYGKIKPFGPYGANLKASLDDPCLNTSFSLRSIATPREENGITRRRIKHLVTFDFVCAGGYNEAAKRYAPGVESFDFDLGRSGLPVTAAAVENLTNTEINEIFGAKVVTIGSTRTTFTPKDSSLRDSDGTRRSVFTSLLDKFI